MRDMTIDEINQTLFEHHKLAQVLLTQRRQLFDTLIQTLMALRVAESHLKRDSQYVCELLARRIPLDACDRAERTLEAVAYDNDRTGL